MLDLERNFSGEIVEATMFLLMGLINLIIALYIFKKIKISFWRGLAYVCICLGLFQLTIGMTIQLKNPIKHEKLKESFQNKDKDYLSLEIKKGQTLLENLNFYKWAGISFFIVGVLVFYFFDFNTSWKGIGMGIIFQSMFMEFLNYKSTSRTKEFLEYLQQNLNQF
tara:strand:+ start:628 stop:1125 length:498 start_codon:yes stop_codon:yes gene_type:complete